MVHALTISLPDLSDASRPILSLQNDAELVIFSPHLDDSVLSCGALLAWAAKTGKKVTVVNIFTEGSDLISPLTQKLFKQAGFENAQMYFKKRHEEDTTALSMLGITNVVNLGLTDAAWRMSEKDSKADYPTTALGQPMELEKNLYENVKTQLLKLKTVTHNSQPTTYILAPLGVGAHTDHILTRNAVAELFGNVMYYVDFPYSDKYPKDEAFIAQHTVKPWSFNQPLYVQKANAIQEYRSQFNGLFPSRKVTLPLEIYYSEF